MINPTITFDHAFQHDCDSTTGWTFNNTNLPSATLTVNSGDIFNITATLANSNNEYAYAQSTNLSLPSAIYKKCLVRWKTSGSSLGLGARCKLLGSSGDKWVIGENNPEFSTTWKVTEIDIGSIGTITNILFYADDYPDSLASGTYSVYFDFALICNKFIFPNVGHGMDVTLPLHIPKIEVPSRIGDITQFLGSGLAIVNMHCDLNIGNLGLISDPSDDWKRPQGVVSKTDFIRGEIFYDNAHNSKTNPWYWLDTGYEQFKVTMENPIMRRDGDNHILDLIFHEFRLSDARNETYIERLGLNL